MYVQYKLAHDEYNLRYLNESRILQAAGCMIEVKGYQRVWFQLIGFREAILLLSNFLAFQFLLH